MSGVNHTKIHQTVNGKKYTYWLVTHYDARGNRIRQKFPTLKEAELAENRILDQFKVDAEKQKILQKRIGEEAEKLTNSDLLDASEALQILDGKARLRDAAKFFMSFNHPGGGKKRIKDLVNEYIARCEKRNLRPTSLSSLKLKLARFTNAFAERWVHQVTTKDVEDWLGSKHVRCQDNTAISERTKKHYAVIVGGLMQYAVRNKYISINPVRPLTEKGNDFFAKKDMSMPEILPVDTVQAIMFKAQSEQTEIVPVLAIGFFAGVRFDEIMKLDWSNVSISAARITIPPEIAKTRAVRHIKMQPNLAQWLIPYAKASGKIAPTNRQFRYRLNRVLEAVKVTGWPHSIMRHCFASYLFAQIEDAAKVAFELGHRDQKMLFDHYRGLATKESAEQYWKIQPVQEANASQFSKLA